MLPVVAPFFELAVVTVVVAAILPVVLPLLVTIFLPIPATVPVGPRGLFPARRNPAAKSETSTSLLTLQLKFWSLS
jgi:hypothetical protein